METILLQLKEWESNIKFDIEQDWNDEKLKNLGQLLRIEQAISLLENIGENNNIPK